MEREATPLQSIPLSMEHGYCFNPLYGLPCNHLDYSACSLLDRYRINRHWNIVLLVEGQEVNPCAVGSLLENRCVILVRATKEAP